MQVLIQNKRKVFKQDHLFPFFPSFLWVSLVGFSSFLSTVELDYNKLGYNKTSAITRTNEDFQKSRFSPIYLSKFTILITSRKSLTSDITRYSFSDTLTTRLNFAIKRLIYVYNVFSLNSCHLMCLSTLAL